MPDERIGLLVMAYGGPNNLDEVEPYLKDVRGGRTASPAVISEVYGRYRRIGGSSPILQRTQAQAMALQAALNMDGANTFQAFVGMRHWHPYIAENAGVDGCGRHPARGGAGDGTPLLAHEHWRILQTGGAGSVTH